MAAGLREMPIRGPWTRDRAGRHRLVGGRRTRRFGRLAWADLLEPAIELAERLPGRARLGRRGRAFGAAVFGDRPATGRARSARTAEPWRVGERVTLPALAGTLRRLAAEGAEAAYSGSLAARAATYLARAGLPVAREADFAAHRSDWTEPIATDVPRRDVPQPSARTPAGRSRCLTLNVLSRRFAPPPPDAFDGARRRRCRLGARRPGGLATGARPSGTPA